MVDPTQLVVLAAAASAHERVRFDYRDGNRQPAARRTAPARRGGPPVYVVAHDNERRDWRTFRVDRMEHAKRQPGYSCHPANCRPTTRPRS
ncbi:WYL domain-containing protein [Micromonospora sp. CPCC 205539]|uniref:WYL domain-containing protein n=1 Tax=Micromonospora sp. CPCC 205539 TaxID=3122408 RepID=UPI003FA60928